MFTLEQIRQANSKVKSGADFPAFIREIKKLGVAFYETFVSNGQSDYYAADNNKTSTSWKYNILQIAQIPNVEEFAADLKTHQQAKTSYVTFCNDCAKSGIEKWQVCLDKMTCTYFDQGGNKILIEQIPQ